MSDELKNKFSNWVSQIIFKMIENSVFQPVGLELSCVNINLETKDDYTFKGIETSEINAEDFPIAYYHFETDSIHIFIEHKFFEKRQEDDEKKMFLFFLLFHEANHRLLLHSPEKRGKEKDGSLWNIACDMEIHNMLYIYKEIIALNGTSQNDPIYVWTVKEIPKFLFDKSDPTKCEGLWEFEYLQNIAEEIYVKLENESKESSSVEWHTDDNNFGVNVKKISVGKNKEIKSVEITGVQPESNDGNEILVRKTLMDSVIQANAEKVLSKEAGDSSSKCKEFLKRLFHIHVDWEKILRNSLQTTLEKSEYFSWSSPRISLFGLENPPYIPTQVVDENAYGTLIVAVDQSGSMSNNECEKAASIISDAKEFYKKLVIIKHDTEISSINEITEINDKEIKELLKRTSNGGTSHKKVFQYINEYVKNSKNDERVSCCIFITDLFSDIEKSQEILSETIPRIYLAPYKSVNLFKESIKGLLIPVEL